jgi:hypothetical protein
MNDTISKIQLNVKCANTLQWLQTVLRGRIAPLVLLDYDELSRRWRIRIKGQLGQIWIGDPVTLQLDPVADVPCGKWDAEADGWDLALPGGLPAPGLATEPEVWITHATEGWWLRYDVIHLMFHMFCRSEEIYHSSPDNHGRFPAAAANAVSAEYLHRPVVDEWMHLLRQLTTLTWPGTKLVALDFTLQVSHDVDFPSRYALCSFRSYARAVAVDIVRHRRIVDVVRSPIWRARGAFSLHPSDPANTFDWIMDVSEQHGLRSAFYFICGCTAPRFDAGYDITQPAMAELLLKIHNRGHEIGLHPSYGTYLSPELLNWEAEQLRSVCASLAINQASWGGRMHFLRWSQPDTLRWLAEAGLSYDATMTYADRAGFRCGTCIEYPAFDPVKCEILPVTVRPLVAMECSIMDTAYMGLGTGAAAYEEFVRLKHACRAVGGTFSLLWHNTELNTPALKDLYRSVLNA